MANVLLSWSSGKDSAWALDVLRRDGAFDVVGLLTTFNEAFDRVAMHAVRRELVEAQAAAAHLPLATVPLPWPCSNDEYEARVLTVLADFRRRGVTHLAFGDLYLADVRDYRVRLLAGSGIKPLFPIWCSPEATGELATTMLAAGLGAVLTCVDPRQIDRQLAGRSFDEKLLEELPSGADRCGEQGEFHTFCHRGPMFDRPIDVQVGESVERDGFVFADVVIPGLP
ncbi:MAG TPA: hypothetical protein VGX78_22920 [Pirellulales bacterium]|nr:hypothetical protein [Pirellulales bacterium]